jgi:hypothetical protein
MAYILITLDLHFTIQERHHNKCALPAVKQENHRNVLLSFENFRVGWDWNG